MAIEIRELKIKGFVDRSRIENKANQMTENQLSQLKKSIVKECTNEVLRQIERKSRR